MAETTLNEGATSLAAANWADATGVVDNGQLVINKPFGSGVPLTSSVDWSALTTGIDYLEIKPGASGTLGSGGSPLKIDADTDFGLTDLDGITNHGKVTLYLEAGGGSSRILNFDCGGGSRNFLVGGTFTTTTVQGGSVDANESTVLTNLDCYGGSGEIHYNATKPTLVRIMRGNWVIRRACTSLIIGENARVIYDPDDAASHTSTAVTNYGGTLDWRAGAIPTVTSIGGTLDFTKARTSFAPGATAFIVGGTVIHEGTGEVDLSNVTYVGRMSRSVGGFTPAP